MVKDRKKQAKTNKEKVDMRSVTFRYVCDLRQKTMML